MDQSEIPNAEQILSALKKRLNQFNHFTSEVSRLGSLEPSFEPKLFHFHFDILEKWGHSLKIVCGHPTHNFPGR